MTFVHLLGLGALAVAQPLFDLLARQPEFLVVRRLDPVDVLAFVAVVLVGPALVALVPWLLLAALGPGPRRLAYAGSVGALSALVTLPLWARLESTPSWLALGGATLVGLGACVLAQGSATFRTFLSVLGLAGAVVPLVFLGNPDIRSCVMPQGFLAALTGSAPARPVPVVMVVFDELGSAELMDASSAIDADLFPAFARLASRSTWYRQHTTVADSTVQAVPALLTGHRVTDPDALPTLQDHPLNLFTLLGRSHTMRVLEGATAMGPPRETRAPRGARLAALLLDATVVWGHLALPADQRERLPDITLGWGGFLTPEEGGRMARLLPEDWLHDVATEMGRDRAGEIEAFLTGLGTPGEDGAPTLDYLHVLLPHSPLEYLPGGRRYTATVAGLGGTHWGDDDDAVRTAWQRHLLQTVFVDRQLGRILDRLEATGLMDRALLVVTADHGVAFAPDLPPRLVQAGNQGALLPVPLFVKRPGQAQAAVDDRFAETVDILPTIADVLGFDLPRDVEGRSLLGEPRPAPSHRSVYTLADGGTMIELPVVPVDGPGAHARRRQAFPREGVAGLHAPGPWSALVGRSLASLPRGPRGEGITLDDPQVVQQAHAPSEVPALVAGQRAGGPALDVALVLNGVVRAVARSSHEGRFDVERFLLFVPEDDLRPEWNVLDVYRLEGTPGSPRLHPVTLAMGHSLTRDDAGNETLLDREGGVHPVAPGALVGTYTVRPHPVEGLRMNGWAVHGDDHRPARLVAVFEGDRFVTAADVDVERPGVVAEHGEAARHSGFRVSIPTEGLSAPDGSGLRAIAVGEGLAAVLPRDV